MQHEGPIVIRWQRAEHRREFISQGPLVTANVVLEVGGAEHFAGRIDLAVFRVVNNCMGVRCGSSCQFSQFSLEIMSKVVECQPPSHFVILTIAADIRRQTEC